MKQQRYFVRSNRTAILFVIIFAVAGIFLAIYYSNNVESETELQEIIPDKTITIGTIGIDAVKHSKKLQPTADYLASKLSSENTTYAGKVVIANSVNDMQDKLSMQEIDLFFDSPLTAVVVTDVSNSIPFLIRWKEQVPTYHTVFFVTSESKIHSLDDFVGKTIVFENPESSSGYFLPKSFLLDQGFTLSEDGSKDITFVFSGEDENTPYFILEDKGQIGTMSNIDFHIDMPENIRSKLRIVEETEEIPRQVVSHRSYLSEYDVNAIKEVLLDMHNDPTGQQILKEFSNTLKYQETSMQEDWFEHMVEMKLILCNGGELIAC